jgi:hypothetical protein
MKKSILCLIIAICVFSALIFLNGCATQPQKYYFGNYSQTLYKEVKDQNDESLLKHKQELEKIISESEKRMLIVPPGICAELGYLNLKSNNQSEAVRLFQKESEIYPESKCLMDRLINKATVKNSKDAVESDLSKENGLQLN